MKELIDIPDKIALVGLAGSGKTTFAKLISNKYSHNIISLAREIKIIVELENNRPIDKALDRKLLQNLGQMLKLPFSLYQENEFINQFSNIEVKQYLKNLFNYRRNLILKTNNCLKSIWVNRLLDFVNHNEFTKVIVDDVRFPEEANSLKKEGFFIVKLEINEKERIERLKLRDGLFDINLLEHESEKNIDKIKCDLTIKYGE